MVADFTDVRQRIDGFGASDRKNPLLTDAEADLFFSASQGIGLSILRASVDPNGTYLNGYYANASKAAARGAVVWAAPWSPPAAWKDNGSLTNGGHLLPAYYDAWASQLANFASLLQQNAGVPLYGISVQNEPDYAAGYASAIYSPQQMVDFIKVLGPKLAALSPRPRLITPDLASWGVLWTYSDAIMSDPLAASYTDVLATHQYFAPAPSPHAIPPGKTLWQTEMSSFDSPATDIVNGITVAKWIHGALADASASAWHYWWLIGQNGDNEGLLNIGDEPTKRLYTLGNFSKFIRPGFVRVGTTGGPSGVYVSAYQDPATNTVVIVAINDSGSSAPLGVELNGVTAASVTPWVTSATEGLAPHAPVAVSDGRFTMTLAAASVTTFVSGNPLPPAVTSASPSSGGVGTLVTIAGANFGAMQGTSTIQFNGAAATPVSWSAGNLVAQVPTDATTGPVVVTVNGVASNGVAFTSTSANATAYVFDTFTGADGTALASHLPNVGGTWLDDVPGNRILGTHLEAANFAGGRSHNATMPASADYEVSVDVTMNITGYANMAGVEGRVQTDLGGIGNSKYEAYFSEGTRTWYLDKWTGWSPTNLASYPDPGFTSGTKTLKLGLVGTAITVYVNGTPVIRVADSSVSAPGYPGIFNQGGIHNGILLDNYLVTNGGTGAPQAPGVPTMPSPTNASTAVGPTPTLAWSATAASTYDVRFGTATPPPLLATTSSASYMTVPLAAGTTYYWQIVANNAVGTTTGPVWSFTTAAALPAPSITNLSPTSGAAGTVVTISGASFGASQGASSVSFNGTAATPTSWTASSIAVPVPIGAISGSVVVTVSGVASNGAPFTVTPTTLPAPWLTQDVGSPAIAGQASYSAGTFSMSAGGVDIWDVGDQFRFVYQPIDGDGEIVAFVGSLQSADPWTKAGVMIREDLAGGSPNAMVEASGANGVVFQSRASRGGPSTSLKFAGAVPHWVRLVRSGTTLSGYHSTDGAAWTAMGSFTIAMATRVYVGLALTSHNASVAAGATFSNVTVTSGVVTPPPNRPPTLTQPVNQTNAEGSTVSVQLVASDPDGTPVAYSATGLPASLSVSPTTGSSRARSPSRARALTP